MIQPTGKLDATEAPSEPRKRRTRRRKTSHLKMVPSTKDLRESLRAKLSAVASSLDPRVPPSKDDLEAICRKILLEEELPEGFLGWAMVVLSSSFWGEQIKSIPPERRLFLLPHCLKLPKDARLTMTSLVWPVRLAVPAASPTFVRLRKRWVTKSSSPKAHRSC